MPAMPGEEFGGVEDWVSAAAEQAADELLTDGRAAISTSRGTVRATLTRVGHAGNPVRRR
jgi:hypothetical protein